MDELSSEAKKLLKLAQAGQASAGPQVRDRVRREVHARLAAAGAGAAGSREGSWFGVGKTIGISVLLLVGGAALYAVSPVGSSVPRPPATIADRGDTAAPVDGPAAPTSSATPADPPPALSDGSTQHSRKATAPSQHLLSAEIAVLKRADEAIASKDLTAAQSALREHRRRFQRPQLEQERDGLTVLVRCMEQHDAAQAGAERYLRRREHSMLADRIKRTCGLVD